MPAIIAALVIKIGRRRLLAPSKRRLETGPRPSRRAALREGYQKDRIRDRDVDSHDRSHEGLNVQRGVCQPQHHHHAGDHRRDGERKRPARAEKIESLPSAIIKIVHDRRPAAPIGSPPNISSMGWTWPRTVTLTLSGGLPAILRWPARTRLAARPRSSPAMFALNVSIRCML